MVSYTFVERVNRTDDPATTQIAGAGVSQRVWTWRSTAEPGTPPSRAKAYSMRDADVTVASPHKYCASAMPANSTTATAGRSLKTALTMDTNAPSPSDAASRKFGAASTTAHSITQPKTPETRTDRTMPRGTLAAAPTVSSAVCADASKPVSV